MTILSSWHGILVFIGFEWFGFFFLLKQWQFFISLLLHPRLSSQNLVSHFPSSGPAWGAIRLEYLAILIIFLVPEALLLCFFLIFYRPYLFLIRLSVAFFLQPLHLYTQPWQFLHALPLLAQINRFFASLSSGLSISADRYGMTEIC